MSAGRVVGCGDQADQLLDDGIGDGGALGPGGNDRVQGCDFAAAAAFVAVEEERLVLDDGTADAPAEDITLEGQDLARGIEVILGIEDAIADKFVDRAVQAVGARLGDAVDSAEKALFWTLNSCIMSMLGWMVIWFCTISLRLMPSTT